MSQRTPARVGTIFSVFDAMVGPVTLLTDPANLDPEIVEEVTRLLDFQEKESFFLHTFGDVGTANYFFEVPSPLARGGAEMAMISVTFDANVRHPRRLWGLLEKFKNRVKEVPGIHGAFHENARKDDQGARVLDLLRKLVHGLFLKVKALTSASYGQIVVLGLDQVGKTSLLKALRSPRSFSGTQSPTLGVNLVRVVFDEVAFLAYDVGGQASIRERWWKCDALPNPDAIVFVHDLTGSKARLREAKSEFNHLLEFYANHRLRAPLLIVGNKVDLVRGSRPSEKSLLKSFSTKKLEGVPCHAAIMSAKTGDGVFEGFKWLISELIRAG